MANRNAPASAFGHSGEHNHAIHGRKDKVTRYDPTGPASAARVRGAKSPGAGNGAVTATAIDDLFTLTGHGFVVGQEVRFTAMTGGAGIVAGTSYYVIASGLTANAFRVSATPGGSTINVTTDMTAGTVTPWSHTYVGGPSREGRVLPVVPGPRK
jgi:hypothetical protein